MGILRYHLVKGKHHRCSWRLSEALQTATRFIDMDGMNAVVRGDTNHGGGKTWKTLQQLVFKRSVTNSNTEF